MLAGLAACTALAASPAAGGMLHPALPRFSTQILPLGDGAVLRIAGDVETLR